MPVDIIKNQRDRAKRCLGRFASLEFETFQNACWDTICSGGALQRRIDTIEFQNDEDQEVITYLYSAFLSMLQNSIDDQIPFWNSRKRQVMIILREAYEPQIVGERKCWRMPNVETDEPTTFDQIEDAFVNAGELKIRFSKNPDSERSPIVSKKDMEAYIFELFNYCGGMIAETDLLEVVKMACGLRAITRVESQKDDPESANQEENPFDRILLKAEIKPQSLAISGYDHRLMAQEIFDGMTVRMKDVFYWRRIKGLKVTDVAKKIGCATGTVSESFNETAKYILEYFCENGANSFPSTEEMNNVTDLVGILVLKEKERL
ncbi:hypothetical protein [Desulfosarcina variabilis]|uniref:hypothetical protein n=1 Tax=Desulfosarcina variabilis TaxID=2300 RepID=UPI003AFAA456